MRRRSASSAREPASWAAKGVSDAARGCLVGLAVGDALGQPTEGWTPEAIQAKWGYLESFTGDAAVSDDTEYTLFSAGVLLEHGHSVTSSHFAEAWLAHIVPASGPFKGAGFSEMAAIENLRRGLRPPLSGKHYHSWSDGFAMRAAPYGVVCPGHPEAACRLAAEDGVVSHAGEGIYGGLAVAAAVSVAMGGAPLEQIVDSALQAVPSDSWTAREIRRALDIAEPLDGARNAIQPLHDALAVTYYPWADLAPEAVGLAFGLLAAGRGDFRETVLAAVNLGRDADTVAAIAGAVLGAKLGYSGLPPEWRDTVGEATGRCLGSIRGVSLHAVADELADLADKAAP